MAQSSCVPTFDVKGNDEHCYMGNSCGGYEWAQLFCTYADCSLTLGQLDHCPMNTTQAKKCRLWGCSAAYFYAVCDTCPI